MTSRSEALKRYWDFVHKVADRTGRSIKAVRSEWKGKVIPTEQRNHVIAAPWMVEAHSKDGKMHATITSMQPLTKEQVRREANRISKLKADEYDGRVYNEDEFDIGQSYLDPEWLSPEEEDEEGSYDFGSEEDYLTS